MNPLPVNSVLALLACGPMSSLQLVQATGFNLATVNAAIDAAPDEIAGTCAGSITGKDHAPIVWHLADEVPEVSP